MRIAALYDIHGNTDALEAVLEEVDAERVDVIVIGGDIAWGPFPAEATQRVQSLGKRTLSIRGNADREVATPPEPSETSWVDEVTTWCHERLTSHQRDFLAELKLTQPLATPELGEVLFCHATPFSDEAIFTAATPEQDVVQILRDTQQGLIVCGHTHAQFDRIIGSQRVVNAGSVGMPYEDNPGAYWALISDEVELRRTEYDYRSAAERMRKSGCPHADVFADNATSPPNREEAIRNFEQQRRRN